MIRDCMMRNCHIRHSHYIVEMDFSPKNKSFSATSISVSEWELNITFILYHWHKNESGCLSKMQVKLDVCDSLGRWQELITNEKEHIFNRRQQHISPSTKIYVRKYCLSVLTLVKTTASESKWDLRCIFWKQIPLVYSQLVCYTAITRFPSH